MPYSDPQRARDYQRQYRARARAAAAGEDPGQSTVQPAVPLVFRLRTADNVLEILEGEVQAVRLARGVTETDRARTICYLCSVALRAINTGDLAARVEVLEQLAEQARQQGLVT